MEQFVITKGSGQTEAEASGIPHICSTQGNAFAHIEAIGIEGVMLVRHWEDGHTSLHQGADLERSFEAWKAAGADPS